MISEHEFVVNGEARRVEANDQTPLLYVLRDDLGLKGTRYGCGSGECGACTVLVDGVAEQSCQLPVSAVSGRTVTTIEGIAGSAELHPLQKAILQRQAGQCGYCLSGIIMAALPLVGSPGPVSREAVRAALERNLCRCGAHTRILDAVEEAWRLSGAST